MTTSSKVLHKVNSMVELGTKYGLKADVSIKYYLDVLKAEEADKATDEEKTAIIAQIKTLAEDGTFQGDISPSDVCLRANVRDLQSTRMVATHHMRVLLPKREAA